MKVVRLITTRQQLQRDDADRAKAVLTAAGISPAGLLLITRQLALLTEPDKQPGGWTFNMLSPKAVGTIWNAIDRLPTKHNRHMVRRVFDQVLLNLEADTGMVRLTRDDIAERAGCSPHRVTQAMNALHKLGVIEAERSKVPGMRGPGIAVYFVNADVAWNGALHMRSERAAQQAQRSLKLVHDTSTTNTTAPKERKRYRAEHRPIQIGP